MKDASGTVLDSGAMIAINMEGTLPGTDVRDGQLYPDGSKGYKGKGRHQRTITYKQSRGTLGAFLQLSPKQMLDKDVENLRAILRADLQARGEWNAANQRLVEQALQDLREQNRTLYGQRNGKDRIDSLLNCNGGATPS